MTKKKILSIIFLFITIFSTTIPAYASENVNNSTTFSVREVPNTASGTYREKTEIQFIVDADIFLITGKSNPKITISLSGNSDTKYTIWVIPPYGDPKNSKINADGSSCSFSFSGSGYYKIEIWPFEGNVGSSTVTANISTN